MAFRSIAAEKGPFFPGAPRSTVRRSAIARFYPWLLVAGYAIACQGAFARAADWPTWRYDAARSAASPDEIAPRPVLLWSRKLSPVRQAWPREFEQRIDFDASYEPVVMDKLLFLASPNDGSIAAYLTETGAERWKFYTEGPVRCALACWKGKIYAGSDDGYLYCLDAQTGALVWKFRGAPAGRPDRRQLGNEHLVSFWPVRGGPVVAGGVVYFGAGIWPVFGVFVHALDAETGKPKWTNAGLNYVGPVRIDHDEFAEVGMSPQGYFVVLRDRILVPNSRALPAGLDRATGRLAYYVQGCRHGDSRVAAHGQFVFVGKEGVLNLGDLREVGSRWAGRGDNKPDGYRGPVLRAADIAALPRVFPHWGYNADWDLYECPGFPYKVADGCNASSAFEDRVAYGSAKGVFYAYNLAAASVSPVETTAFGKTIHPLAWRPQSVWQFDTPYAGQPSGTVIKAGQRLYGHVGRRLLALEDLRKKPRLAWEQELAATPTSLVAADNKLFAATAEGGIYCFGRPGEASAGPKTYAGEPVPLASKTDAWPGKVRQITEASGVESGYCLVLGVTDGRLIEELLKRTELSVLAVDRDGRKIERLRRRFDAAGLLGSRVELFVGEPLTFGFPPYLASLIVSEDPEAAGFSAGHDAAKALGALRPYGGTLCLEMPQESHASLLEWTKAAAVKTAVKRDGGWSLLVREGALAGAADWTHEAADAACTFTSQDDLVKAPLGVLWYGDGNGFAPWHDYNHAVKPQVSGGRVYAIAGGTLVAYDAYTGRPLWKKQFNAFCHHARFAAMADAIYLVADGKCMLCEPASGRTLRTFTFNAAGATTAKDLRVGDEVIVVACSGVTEKDVQHPDYENNGYFESRTLVCLDRKTGAELWRTTAKRRFHNLALAMGGGLFYCTDSISNTAFRPALDGAPAKETESTIRALDLRTGAQIWSRNIAYAQNVLRWGGEFVQFSAENAVLLVGRKPHPIGLGAVVSGLDAKTGRILWEKKTIGQAPVILHGKTFISGDIADHGGSATMHDLFTGEKTGDFPFRVDGCNYIIGSRHLVMARNATVAYADIEEKKNYNLRNIRSGCSNSLPAADGLLNAPNYAFGCVCNYPIQTSFAMVYMPEVAGWSGTEPLTVTAAAVRPGAAAKAGKE
jgi:outer membrane protein assembly factor BamB